VVRGEDAAEKDTHMNTENEARTSTEPAVAPQTAPVAPGKAGSTKSASTRRGSQKPKRRAEKAALRSSGNAAAKQPTRMAANEATDLAETALPGEFNNRPGDASTENRHHYGRDRQGHRLAESRQQGFMSGTSSTMSRQPERLAAFSVPGTDARQTG